MFVNAIEMDGDNDENVMDFDNNDEEEESSDYNSDCSSMPENKKYYGLDEVQISKLSNNKFCCIEFYYSDFCDYEFCTECFLELTNMYNIEDIFVVREHRTLMLDAIQRLRCANCNRPLYQIMMRELCPICTVE